ncbi:hypothetical protein GCM10010245_00100 [Streptomyces spectabilis]|nr:hypothetical protein GCM10010245_00100 [Streptomyces spectabilis]
MYIAHVRCLVCGERTIYCRADVDRPRAWCVNDACVDENTNRPRPVRGQPVVSPHDALSTESHSSGATWKGSWRDLTPCPSASRSTKESENS